MNAITDCELQNIDPDDIGDVLVKVEKSFDIKFKGTELMHISTFGELCDHITDKIQLDHSSDCTNQQAFYKLREAIASTAQIDSKTITVNTVLTDIFPKHGRRLRVKKLERHLGFKLDILRPPFWLTLILAIFYVASLAGIYFNWPIGLTGLMFSHTSLWIAHKTGKLLDLQTVGQLAKKMTAENYLKSRRNPTTCNKIEIEKVLTDLFSSELYLDKSKLTREAKLA